MGTAPPTKLPPTSAPALCVEVAVKVIRNRPAYTAQAQTECRVLHLLHQGGLASGSRAPIVRLLHAFVHKGHVCLAFELLALSLLDILRLNGFTGVSLGLVRAWGLELCAALAAVHGMNVIHCDVKPENILLASQNETTIRLIDFGSASFAGHTPFSYVQSRFYRSPEVILGLPYAAPIDVWSAGCVLAEVFFGIPVFPGESNYGQIVRIVEMMGMPPDHMLDSGAATAQFFKRIDDPPRAQQAPGAARARHSQGSGAASLGQELSGSDLLGTEVSSGSGGLEPGPLAQVMAKVSPIPTASTISASLQSGEALPDPDDEDPPLDEVPPPIDSAPPRLQPHRPAQGSSPGLDTAASAPPSNPLLHHPQQPGSGRYRLKTPSEFAADAGLSGPLPVPKRYFRYSTLRENIMHYPMRANMSPEAQEAEMTKRQAFTHLLTGLLQWDPAKRWPAEVALNHPFLRPVEPAQELLGGLDHDLGSQLAAFSSAAEQFIAAQNAIKSSLNTLGSLAAAAVSRSNTI